MISRTLVFKEVISTYEELRSLIFKLTSRIKYHILIVIKYFLFKGE